ncbi:chemoreceptor glutamine deamidase CheD [bacterium]|nr:chemoreceptor glutamine deamidase CheD [bacterium]
MNALTHSPPPRKQRAFRGFENINRYWDKHRKLYVAKLLPGDFYVTAQSEAITTVLGSCISACIWDEKKRIGGMNHFMLPTTHDSANQVQWGNRNIPGGATRYGNYAMEHLINEILKHGGQRENLKVKLFGGAKIIANMSDVGKKNSDFALDYIKTENLCLISDDLYNNYPRKIFFDPLTGRAFMKRLKSLHNDTVVSREKHYEDSLSNKPIEGDVELF